jgi:hypothetical protein
MLTLHGLVGSAGSLLPYLHHMELKDREDCLIQCLDKLMLPRLQTLILPPHMLLSPDVQHLLPHLHTLVYISDSFHTTIILNSLASCSSLRRLTLSYIQPMAMVFLSCLHQLTSLTLVIIPGLSIMKETNTIPDHHIQTQVLNIHIEPDSHMESISVNTGFPALLSLLSNHHITCQGLSINIHQEYCSADVILHFFNALTSLAPINDDDDEFLAWENLIAFRLQMPWDQDFFILDEESIQIPRNGLAALHRLVYLTALELQDLGTCRIDDDALLSLALSLPYLQCLLLGTRQFWEEPPRATLWGISFVLHYCPHLETLGLLFCCSLGDHKIESADTNNLITTLHVGFSPPHSSFTVAAFLAHSLPNLDTIMVEPAESHRKWGHSRTDLTVPDRDIRIQEWSRILELTTEFAEI